jgi:hypothetical protein
MPLAWIGTTLKTLRGVRAAIHSATRCSSWKERWTEPRSSPSGRGSYDVPLDHACCGHAAAVAGFNGARKLISWRPSTPSA